MRISPPFLSCKNIIFELFFLQLKLRTIFYKKQEKKLQNFILVLKNLVEKNFFFFHRRFFTAVFFNSGQFSPNLNHILIGLEVPNTALKNQGGLWGDFFELFSLRRNQ
jgi:hypothetical protein